MVSGERCSKTFSERSPVWSCERLTSWLRAFFMDAVGGVIRRREASKPSRVKKNAGNDRLVVPRVNQ